MLEEVRARIPSLRIVVEGDGGGQVSMFVDGVEVPPSAHDFPRKVDPGEHVVRVMVAGFRPEERTVQVDERQEEVVTITLTPTDGDAPVVDPWGGGSDAEEDDGSGVNGYAVMMWTGFAFAAAGAIAGTVTGAMSIAKKGDLEEKCGGESCTQELIDERNSALPIAHVSTASFVVAGVAGVIGHGRARVVREIRRRRVRRCGFRRARHRTDVDRSERHVLSAIYIVTIISGGPAATVTFSASRSSPSRT